MAGRIGPSGSQGRVAASEVEGAEAVSGGAGDGASSAAEGAGASNAKRSARPKSLDMGAFDLASRLNATLEGATSAAGGSGKTAAAGGAAAKPAAAGASPTAEFDAALARMQAGGLDGKEAKALMKIVAQSIKSADDPGAAAQALFERSFGLYDLELTPEAKKAVDEAEDKNYVTLTQTFLSRAKGGEKKLGDYLKANAATLKAPLSEIDPKSLTGATNGEMGHVEVSLKNGRPVQIGDKHAQALEALLKSDPKLGAVRVGHPKIE